MECGLSTEIKNTLRIAAVNCYPPKAGLGVELEGLLDPVFRLILHQYPHVPYIPENGLMGHLSSIVKSENDPTARQYVLALIKSLRAYFYMPDPDRSETNPGQIRLGISRDKLLALLTLIPPRGDGTIPTLNSVREALKHSGITNGVDYESIEKCLSLVRQERDIVWQSIICKGKPPVPHTFSNPKYRNRIVDKSEFKRNLDTMGPALNALARPVTEGELIGTLFIEPGKSGKDVFGGQITPPKASLLLDLTDISISDDYALRAQATGHILADNNRLDIVPFYIMEHPTPDSLKDFSFPGAVLVKGNLRGPGRIECEDIFVLGNCEEVKIVSHNDVFVSGGIVGHRKTCIDADGSIYASFVSEARLSAVGKIVVSNAILYSRIMGNDIVQVTSNKGMIAGGTICSMLGIIAAKLGSEFGMRTETIVGRDFLTPARLKSITDKIAVHEENLRRIHELKAQLARSRVSIERMPPDKQEIFIGILRKEEYSQARLRSLLRQKKTLGMGLKEFLSATVRVLDTIYPPVRVQIADSIKEITEKLEGVTLSYSRGQGIVNRLMDDAERERLA